MNVLIIGSGGREHALAVIELNFSVREGEAGVGRRYKHFAWHFGASFEYRGIEDIPRANLLLDHVETCEF